MKFIYLRFWRSEVRSRAPWARIKALGGRVLSGGSRGEPLPQLPEAAYTPPCGGSTPILKLETVSLRRLPPSIYRDACDYLHWAHR